MTLTCYKLKFSWNFARFGSQQQLNDEDRPLIVSNGIVAH